VTFTIVLSCSGELETELYTPVPPRHVRDVTNFYCTLFVTYFIVITMCTSLEDFFRGSKWYPPQMVEKTATPRRDKPLGD